jgi:hypothetical protein
VADDAEIDLNFNDHASPRIRNLGDNLNDLGREAVRTRGRVEDLAGETGTLSRRLIAARQQAEFMSRRLDRAVTPATLRDFEQATRQVRALERAMRAVDRLDPDVDVDVHVDRNRFQRTFGGLVESAQRAGLLVGNATITGFREALNAIPSEVKLVVGVAAAAAALVVAPFVLGIIDAALLAAAGLGGLAAGIIIAARDPAVKAAFGDLGQDIMRELTAAVAPFVPELIKSAEIFGAAFERQAPRVRAIFADLAPAVSVLAEDLAEGFEGFLPGFQRAVHESLPLLRQLGTSIKNIMILTGQLFDAAAQAGPTAQLVWKALLGNVEALLVALGALLRISAPATNAVARLGDALGLWDIEETTGTLVKLGGATEDAGDAASSGVTSYNNFAYSIQNTADAADTLNSAFERLFTEAMNLDQANLAVKSGMLELRETIKANGKTLDDNTAKGNANAVAILDQIEALEAKRQAEIEAGDGTKQATDQANAAYAANVAALRNVLVQLGLNAAEVDRLIAKYAQIPHEISTTVTTVYRTKGTPPGYSDQLTGHSRTGGADYSGMSDWAPFAYEEGFRAAAASAGAGGGSSRVGGPAPISINNTLAIDLDGRPFRQYTDRSISEADKRRRWREYVGER